MLATLALAVVAHATSLDSSSMEFSAWVVFWNPDSLATFEAQAKKHHEALPEWAYVNAEGKAVRRAEPEYAEARKRFLRIARENGVLVYGMTNNYGESGFDAERMTKMLATPESRQQHARDLVKIAVEDGLDGIDVDYESMRASDRDAFSDFVEELSRQLKAAGKRISIAVHPKTSEPGNWDGVISQDWNRLSKAVDRFRVMTYDEHWATSAPGPIASNRWVEQVMDFGLTLMPKEKLHLGLANYGYDWNQTPATSLTWKTWGSRPLTIDQLSGEYVDGKVRFSGYEAAKAKFDIAKKRGLGVSMWYTGSEEPRVWSLLTARR